MICIHNWQYGKMKDGYFIWVTKFEEPCYATKRCSKCGKLEHTYLGEIITNKK